MNAQELVRITGQHQLFFGIETYSWSIDRFKQAAQFARAHKVDSLLIKMADGVNIWYGGLGGWHNIRQAILAEGVGAIPYMYSYGNQFGALDAEIDIMIACMRSDGIMCTDMETEWNGQVGWAQHLTSRILPVPGIFMVSTWADPSLQNWLGVIRALAPCTAVFMPQQYNNFLATFWGEFSTNGATWLQPTVNVNPDPRIGPNDPVAIARDAFNQGHTAVSVWYHEPAVANSGLLDAVYAAFSRGVDSVSIEQAAHDTWNSTAHLFGGSPLPYDTGIAKAWRDLYVNQHKLMPPPTTREFSSVDWYGNPIVAQFFGGIRCEWDGQAHWYQTGL